MTDEVTWPDGITESDVPALEVLAAEGIGEGDFGESHHVPADLLTLHEVLEWEAAVGGKEEPRDG